MAGLYIHIPFCAKKCAYCDFVSFAGREALIPAYLDALCGRILSLSGFAEFETVYIGGGTPSVLPHGAVKRVMDEVFERFSVKKDAEITIEANPHSLTAKKLDEYLSCGVNRVSLGVQSLSDELLAVLGRAHDASEAVEAMRLLRDGGVNWSADVMLSLPGQSKDDVSETLYGVFEFGPAHISAYPLILERGTRLCESVAQGELALPGEDEAYALESFAADMLERALYGRYEISSFAKPGYESRHNLNYWNNGAYAGVGLAAHGARRAENGMWLRTENTADMGAYLAGEEPKQTLVPQTEEMFECVMLSLRKTEGLSLAAFEGRFHARFETMYARQIDECETRGLLKIRDGYAFLTRRGMEIQNLVLELFL